MDKFLDAVRDRGRRIMLVVAKGLNRLTFGKLHPNVITYTSLLAHVGIAYCIMFAQLRLAAVLLIFFGLFDALDGSLARVQNRASNAGMLLDAVTDRMKEVFLYLGALEYFYDLDEKGFLWWTLIALGGSLLVSYVKAKGETAIKDANLSPNEINRLFSDGLMRFEVRMTILIAGLLLNQLGPAIVIIAVLTWITTFQRLFRISKKLS